LPAATATPQPSPTATPDYSADYQKVQTDPWTATDEEKSGYDIYVRQQLATKGVENTGTLSDYDLLEAVIDYQQALIAKGGLENTEDYLVELPISLHELIRSDQNNLIDWQRNDKNGLWYGIGDQYFDMGFINAFHNAYTPISFYGKDIDGNVTNIGVHGDLAVLYKTPGMQPDEGIGAVLRMYHDNNVRYVEVFIPITSTSPSSGDLCLYSHIREPVAAVPCDEGEQRQQGYLFGYGFVGRNHSTVENLLQAMQELKTPHILVHANWENGSVSFSDGIEIILAIEIQEPD